MCGITGQYKFRTQAPVDPTLIRRMTDALVHRGPDAEGFFTNGPIGLGFRRLAIIDLSPHGNQPITNEDGTIQIIFNGEVYNFQELRPALERKGHVFRSHTDTETIVHLYEEHGVGCLQYLRGMFAFALWDAKQQRLLLARDRVGKKPLKYHLSKDGITFASEIKALLVDPSVPRQIDERAIHHFLTLQYVPSPLTGFRGIRKLPPAHYLLVENGMVKIERYWQLRWNPKRHLPREEWRHATLEHLEEAVRLRLIADVPLGAFLSGGVDSSTVVALMAKHSARPVKTFSIGFEDAMHNELPMAKLVAERYGTEHTEFVVRTDAAAMMPELAARYDEPYADASALPSYYLARLTRKQVTVALNGDGGDENFAGYPWYVAHKLAARLDWQPLAAILAAGGLAAQGLGAASWSTTWRRAVLFARSLGVPRPERYAQYFTTSYFTDAEKLMMYTKEFRNEMRNDPTTKFFAPFSQQSNATGALDRALATDIAAYLPDDLLVKVDIASMANSLEARSPFLDHRFMEFAATMPAAIKMPGRAAKQFFRETVRELVPAEILSAKKRGFVVPLDAWFRTELRPLAGQVLLSGHAEIHRYVRRDAMERLVREHAVGRVGHGSRLWALCMLELWLQHFFSHP